MIIRLLRDQQPNVGPGAAISIVAHLVLVALAIQSTRPPADLVNRQWIENRIYFIPPPNRVLGQPGANETLRFIELAAAGPGSGAATGIPTIDVKRPSLLNDLGIGRGQSVATTIAAPKLTGTDSAYSILEVDSAVVPDPTSGAPEYPAALLAANVEGVVSARYVVDTTGRADPASLVIVSSTAPAFAASVRAALPTMRFAPARRQGRLVRQLVQQEFTFRITQAAAIPDTGRGEKPPR